MGDFNDVINQEEKQGGRYLYSGSSRGLYHFMESMGLWIWDFLETGSLGLIVDRTSSQLPSTSLVKVSWWLGVLNLKVFGIWDPNCLNVIAEAWEGEYSSNPTWCL